MRAKICTDVYRDTYQGFWGGGKVAVCHFVLLCKANWQGQQQVPLHDVTHQNHSFEKFLLISSIKLWSVLMFIILLILFLKRQKPKNTTGRSSVLHLLQTNFTNAPPFLFLRPYFLTKKKIFALHPDGNQAADKLWQLRWGFAAVCSQGGDGEPNDFNHHQWPSLTFTVCLGDTAPPSVRRLFSPIRFGWLPGNVACLSAINAAFESSTELENAAGSPEAKTLFDVRDVHGGKIQQNWKVLMGWEAAEAPSICLSEGREEWRMRWRGVRANQELAFRQRKLWETFNSFWIGSVAV